MEGRDWCTDRWHFVAKTYNQQVGNSFCSSGKMWISIIQDSSSGLTSTCSVPPKSLKFIFLHTTANPLPMMFMSTAETAAGTAVKGDAKCMVAKTTPNDEFCIPTWHMFQRKVISNTTISILCIRPQPLPGITHFWLQTSRAWPIYWFLHNWTRLGNSWI